MCKKEVFFVPAKTPELSNFKEQKRSAKRGRPAKVPSTLPVVILDR